MIKRFWHGLHVARQIGAFFKTWARYLSLASVALVALNAESYLRAIPGNPSLNYIAYGLGGLAILGALSLRHSKWFSAYFKAVLRSVAWSFATIGFIFLGFPRDLVPFFSLSFSVLQNTALAAVIVTELSLVGLMFWTSDGARESEAAVLEKWRKKDSTPDWDAIIKQEEFA
jgi:hypothetical protein